MDTPMHNRLALEYSCLYSVVVLQLVSCTKLMWFFQVSFSSIITPKHFTNAACCIMLLFIFRLIFVSYFFLFKNDEFCF